MDNDERQSPQPHNRSWFRELTEDELERAVGGMGEPTSGGTIDTGNDN